MSAAGATWWGFHRLAPDWAERIVRQAGVRPGELVIDLGAGTGALTGYLVESGARVVAMELHPGRASQLRSRFGSRIRVVEADARDLRLPGQPFRVVANPPFASSAAILRRLVGRGSQLVTADLVLPAQMAARWAHGRAGAAGHRPDIYSARVAGRLPASAFRPAAPMATSILRLERRDGWRSTATRHRG